MTTKTTKAAVAVAAVAALGALVPTAALASPRTIQEPAGPTQNCAGLFHVLHNDRIGSVNFRRGYWRMTTQNVSCHTASKDFAKFLQRPSGNLPHGYRVSGTGTLNHFTRIHKGETQRINVEFVHGQRHHHRGHARVASENVG